MNLSLSKIICTRLVPPSLEMYKDLRVFLGDFSDWNSGRGLDLDGWMITKFFFPHLYQPLSPLSRIYSQNEQLRGIPDQLDSSAFDHVSTLLHPPLSHKHKHFSVPKLPRLQSNRHPIEPHHLPHLTSGQNESQSHLCSFLSPSTLFSHLSHCISLFRFCTIIIP